jgi:hypothetical protein
MLQKPESFAQAEASREGTSGKHELAERILRLLDNGPVSLEDLTALYDLRQSEAMSSIARLVADGNAQLVILEYPWGIEFNLQRVSRRTCVC